MHLLEQRPQRRDPWNKGKLVGQKPPLKIREIWAIRIRLQIADRKRDLALFNLAIDSRLRACDLVSLRVIDVAHGNNVAKRAMITQRKTQRPVQFEITEQTRQSIRDWIDAAALPAPNSSFRVECSEERISQRATTADFCARGPPRSGWIHRRTELILSAERKRR